jgi:hypothetical protein
MARLVAGESGLVGSAGGGSAGADEAKREAFVAFYVALRQEAERLGAKIFFVDEAHFRADADLRGL